MNGDKNRHFKMMMESVANRTDMTYVQANEPSTATGLDALVPVVAPTLLALFGFYAWGQLFAVAIAWVDYQQTIGLAVGATAGLVAYLTAYWLSVSTGGMSFVAEFDGVGVEEPASSEVFLPSSTDNRKRVRVDREMLDRLEKLAELYGRGGYDGLAIGKWTGSERPFSRGQFEQMRHLLSRLGLVDEQPDGQLVLNAKGAAAFRTWKMGDFGDLVDSPPPPGGSYG